MASTATDAHHAYWNNELRPLPPEGDWARWEETGRARATCTCGLDTGWITTRKGTTVTHRVQIEHTTPDHARVLVDGHDISHAVRAVTWESEVGHRPRLLLDLDVYDVTSLSSQDTEIRIPDDTRDALIKLGWTPPET